MITELNLTPSQRESEWVINVYEEEASEGVNIRDSISDYRYGIRSINVCSGEDEQWIKLKNGEDDFIGPFLLSKNIPYNIVFTSPVYCDKGNALVLQTETDFPVYLCIQGITGPPIPTKTFSPSPTNGAVDISTSSNLSWDSTNESVTYHVYLGTNINDLTKVSEQNELEYEPTLSGNTTYYWRVDEVYVGNSMTGDVWTFTTGS